MLAFIDIERLIHSIKTVIAVILGFAAVKFIGTQTAQWILISIVVVMCAQLYVGSVFGKAFLRLLGTAMGCVIGSLTIFFLGTSDASALTGLAVAGFFFSYLSTSSENLTYAGTLGAATAVIILINNDPTIDLALERFLEISIGILIAAFVSQFVLPIHAKHHLRHTQAKTLKLLAEYYQLCMLKEKKEESAAFEELDQKIVKLISKQRALAKEAKNEPFGVSYDARVVIKILECEKDILRAIDFMHHALTYIQKSPKPWQATQAILDFNQAINNVFSILTTAMQNTTPPKTRLSIPEVVVLKVEMKKIAEINQADVLYVDGYLFAVETLVRSLRKLSLLCRISLQEDEQKKSQKSAQA